MFDLLCFRINRLGDTKLLSNHIVDLEIGGAEVVGPLRCAMDFIHTYHGDFSAELGKVLDKEAFW